MSIIRDNKLIILGITGYTGSGCTSLAEYLSIGNFFKDIKVEIDRDYNSIINEYYNQLQNSKKEEGNSLKDQIKGLLEKREIINVIKRNKFELRKKVYYLSFSNAIIYFIIKHIKKIDGTFHDEEIGRLLQRKMNLDEAICSIRIFDDLTRKNSRSREISKSDLEKIKKLLETFYLIRDEIKTIYGVGRLQDYGDNIRKNGSPFKSGRLPKYETSRYLSSTIDKQISFLSKYFNEKYFVVEAIRNPQELYYFREKHSYFYLIALDLIQDLREIRNKNTAGLAQLYIREQGDDKNYDFSRIDIPRCVDLSDIVVSNNGEFADMFWKLLRFFALIIEPGCVKPTKIESLMQIAYTLAARSNCISRQVGAVITNDDGYIIGAGWNDVGEGRISCGLKMANDYKNIDYYRQELNQLNLANAKDSDYICFKGRLPSIEDRNLVNCMALHAEENAIIQLAKYSSGNLKGSEIYSTSYPCNLCMKKICQAGINKIVYSESYPNNKSAILLKDIADSVEICRFEGIKYFSYFKLFKPYYDRKEQQEILK